MLNIFSLKAHGRQKSFEWDPSGRFGKVPGNWLPRLRDVADQESAKLFV